MKRDLLTDIYNQTIAEDEAYDLISAYLEESPSDIAENLSLSRAEWTAYCHGASPAELARWRHNGWPSSCPACGEKITPEAFGWFAIEAKEDEDHVLVHVQCLERWNDMNQTK